MRVFLDAPRLRPERLIAAGRVVLAVFSLLAVWLDQTEPAYHAQVAYGLLVAYVAYAVLIASLLWRAEAVWPAWPVVTHVADLTFFSLFIFFTAGPAGPFTVYFVFALICAALRWQLRGTVWTAVVTLTAFGSFGLYFGVVLASPDFDLTAFIIRGVYMFVLAVLLGYVGFHDQRLLRELRILASWPQSIGRDAESLSRELLDYAGPLLEAPRVILAWTEQDAPWRRVATWTRTSWEHERDSGSTSLVDAGLRGRSFIRSARQPARTMAREPGLPHLVAWPGESLDPDFADRFAIRGTLSVPIRGESFDGRLFFLDKEDSTLDDLVLAEIVAGIVAARFDAFYLTEQLRHAAATEERIRLARDLHDGVLQSFTGVALRLAAVRRVLRHDPAAAAEALQNAQDVLASEQRDLRFFIQELRPTLFALEDERELGARLRQLAQRMEREWDLRVSLDVRLADTLPPALCRDLYHIVREALVNAARHGAATVAQVQLDDAGPDGIVVSIADNGRGFPFSGEFSGNELAERDLGPKTLRERVLAMNGTLTLQSSGEGAELHIVLPGAA